jgi:haloacid dehalogenase-like hydrolase
LRHALALLLIGTSLVAAAPQEDADPSPAPPSSLDASALEDDPGVDLPAAILFDVSGTLTYRDPETGKYGWYRDALPAAMALREMGLRVGLLSNVPRGWDVAMLGRLLLEPEPLEKLFDPIVLAQSPARPGEPPPKPDPFAYQIAVGRLGDLVAPADVLYVGEDPADIQGANLAGLRGLLLVRRGSPPAGSDSVRSLEELVTRFGGTLTPRKKKTSDGAD